MSEGFTPRTEAMLARAAKLCAARGARLTELRQQVLGLILERAAPTSAYDLLERLRARRGGAAPPTVYRALGFLLEQGLIHRVELLSAFVGCVAEDGPECDHAAQFLICRACGRVTELDDPALAAALTLTAKRQGFSVAKTTIEAEGVCAGCAAREKEDMRCS
jgi:Fur family transcriptional regulator, zinc uptake regulator